MAVEGRSRCLGCYRGVARKPPQTTDEAAGGHAVAADGGRENGVAPVHVLTDQGVSTEWVWLDAFFRRA